LFNVAFVSVVVSHKHQSGWFGARLFQDPKHMQEHRVILMRPKLSGIEKVTGKNVKLSECTHLGVSFFLEGEGRSWKGNYPNTRAVDSVKVFNFTFAPIRAGNDETCLLEHLLQVIFATKPFHPG
jgi:hypothetical protein